MRKLKIIEHISLDGVAPLSGDDGNSDFPYGDWTAPYRTPAGREVIIVSSYKVAGLLKKTG